MNCQAIVTFLTVSLIEMTQSFEKRQRKTIKAFNSDIDYLVTDVLIDVRSFYF